MGLGNRWRDWPQACRGLGSISLDLRKGAAKPFGGR